MGRHLILTAALALLTMGAWADGVIDIVHDGVTTQLDTPGSYRLADDVTVTAFGPGVPVIWITSDDVTLDLNGHTIDVNGFSLTGIQVSGDRAEIFNGTVTSSAVIGLSTDAVSDLWLHDLLLQGNDAGISIGASAERVLIERCVANNSTTADGILIAPNTSQVTVRQCEAKGNGNTGIVIQGSDHVVVDNVASGNNRGIVMNTAVDSIVADNFCSGNTLAGIREVNPSVDPVIVGNTCVGNGTGFSTDGGSVHFFDNYAAGNTTNYTGVSSVTSQAAANDRGDNLTP